jgi:hypothetical protein
MNQTQRDLINLFFRRDSLRERVYPTRVTYLAITIIVMVGMALLFVGAARFHESLGLTPLSSPTKAASSPTQNAQAAMETPTQPSAIATATVTIGQGNASPTAQSPETLLTPAPANHPVRCPITWKVQEVVVDAGTRIGRTDDQTAYAVWQDYLEAVEWGNSPSSEDELTEADQYYTPGMADAVRRNLQQNLNQRQYVRVEMPDSSYLSMSFTTDGGGVTFMNVQYTPITQAIVNLDTHTVQKTLVVDNGIPYLLVGVAMLYDTQDCRWKVDRIEWPEPRQSGP